MKRRPFILIFLYMLAAVSLATHCTAVANGNEPVDEPVDQAQPSISATAEANMERFQYPQEYRVFQDYLNVIAGEPGKAETILIEGTVLSITSSYVCPYPEEQCRIAPYPRDWGIVRVDRIITEEAGQQPASLEASEQTGNSPSQPDASQSGEGTAEQVGSSPTTNAGSYLPLREGLEIETLFVLTVSPVKVVYAPLPTAETSNGLERTSEVSGNAAQQTVQQQSQTTTKTFEPLPTAAGQYAFTTRIGEFSELVEHHLPGLVVGSKFQAEARYNGILYVQEYVVLD